MTNHFIKKGTRATKGLRLSETEKAAMLARLDAHMRARPAPAQPARGLASSMRENLARFSYEYSMAVILILVVTGGSVASAAEGALPGDTLYPVKVYVTEPARGALAVGDVRKARWEAERAVRRLEEAEALEAAGRLTASSTEAVRAHFEESKVQFEAIRERSREGEEHAEIERENDDFKQRLEEHQEIISTIGGREQHREEEHAEDAAGKGKQESSEHEEVDDDDDDDMPSAMRDAGHQKEKASAAAANAVTVPSEHEESEQGEKEHRSGGRHERD